MKSFLIKGTILSLIFGTLVVGNSCVKAMDNDLPTDEEVKIYLMKGPLSARTVKNLPEAGRKLTKGQDVWEILDLRLPTKENTLGKLTNVELSITKDRYCYYTLYFDGITEYHDDDPDAPVAIFKNCNGL